MQVKARDEVFISEFKLTEVSQPSLSYPQKEDEIVSKIRCFKNSDFAFEQFSHLIYPHVREIELSH